MRDILAYAAAALRRITQPAAARTFESAAGGRRWEGAGSTARPVTESLAARGPTLRRARYSYNNNPHARAAVETLVSAIAGTGMKPQSRHPDEATRRQLNEMFEAWTDRADADQLGDFYTLQSAAARGVVRDGEAFVRFEQVGGAGTNWTSIRSLDPEMIDPALHRDLGGGARIIAGIEFDASGRRVAYHVMPDRIDAPFATIGAPVRVPAGEILHIFKLEFPGQVRGISWLAPVLLRLRDHDETEDALLMKLKTESLIAGFIYDATGGAGGFDGEQNEDILKTGLEPGTLKVLPPGKDIKFSAPSGTAASAGDFLKSQLRAIAAGTGTTYEQLSGDLSGVNYSSIRAGLIEFRRRVETFQHNCLAFQFCRPVWNRWLLTEAMAGRIDARAYLANPAAFQSVNWIPPGWAWVDPEKEIRADAEAVREGFKSRREVVAGRGLDIERLDEERAADAGRTARLGLQDGQEATA